MKNYNFLFLVFCMSLTFGLAEVYHLFDNYFSPVKEIKYQVEVMDKSLHSEKFRAALLEGQIKNLEQSIASMSSTQGSKEVVDLMGAVRMPASDLKTELSSVLMEKANSHFRKKEYVETIAQLKKLINEYPSSAEVIRAHFLLAETYYLLRDYQNSLNTIDLMLEQFPEHEMTGYIMLRMAQIFEIRSRSEEAAEVYRTIIRVFDNKNLKDQAELLLKKVSI